MEDKKLDFNAPLLSVRRFSSKTGYSEREKCKKNEVSHGSKHYIPSYNSELKSGPLRNPGTIPFTWEKIPGRPKDEGIPQFQSLECPPIAPKLPPGRTTEVKQQSSEESEEKQTVINTGCDGVINNHEKHLSLEGNATKLESSKGSMKKNDSSSSEDGDDVYADALDTLSRSESFFFNCSLSGVSGLDGSNVKPSGVFMSDPQTRDFMMGRFLPAAKAMTSETIQHAPRRHPVVREQPSQVKKVVNSDRKYTFDQYTPNRVPYVQDLVEEESEGEDDDYSDTGISAKACGFLPRFCLKNSFCLLNPVPGMKVRTRSPLSSVRRAPQARTASSGSHSATNDENNWEAVYKHKVITDLQRRKDESKLTSESNHWSDSQSHDSSSLNMGSGGGGISPYRNDTTQSPFHEGRGFLGIPKQNTNFKAKDFDPSKDSHINCQEKDPEILTKSMGMEDISVAVSCIEDMQNLSFSKERTVLQPKIAALAPNDSGSSLDRSNVEGHINSIEGFRKDDGCAHDGSRTFMCSIEDCQGNANVRFLLSPLPPPLPKSPSESWLRRTLPSVSTKNAAQFHPRKQSIKTSSTDPKWEIIVKTSNLHHGHLGVSKELTTSLSQQSET